MPDAAPEKTMPRIVRDIILGVVAGVVIEATLQALHLDFLLPALPYIWLLILIFLTVDGLKRSQNIREWVVPFYGSLTARRRMISYIVVGLLGAAIAIFYWWGISSIFRARRLSGNISPKEETTAIAERPEARPPATIETEASPSQAPTASLPPARPPRVRKKSLKQRVDAFGKELFDWVEKKDQENPGPSIVGGDQVQNAYQMGAQSVYMKQAEEEYERMFAPRGVALQEELRRCGLDISKHPFFTNPGLMANTMIGRHLSLAFRATAASMPDDDKDLKCDK